MAAAGAGCDVTVEQVAAYFAEAVRVSDRYYQDLAELQDDRQPLAPRVVARLRSLLALVEPAARMREALGAVSTEMLFAGLHLWGEQREAEGMETLPLWTAGE